MKIVFRTDASIQIGTGHVMRCLTLADALRLEGADCTFICRAHTGHLIELIRAQGHHVVALAAHEAPIIDTASSTTSAHAIWLGTDWITDASDTQNAIGSSTVDWLVVDHYALDESWEKAMRTHCHRIMAIDDLADRRHDCDLLLDQNLGRTEEHYRQLIPRTATSLIGPRYALLRPEFSALREESLAKRKHPQLKHLLITLGGVDKDNVTGNVLNELRSCDLPSELHITVVIGAHAPWLQNVQDAAEAMPWSTQVLVNVKHMARLMVDSDLAIGAAGGTAWERCSLGLPSLMIVTAENQRNGAASMQKIGAAFLCRSHSDISAFMKNSILSSNQHTLMKQQSMAAAAITTGNGATLVLNKLRHLYV